MSELQEKCAVCGGMDCDPYFAHNGLFNLDTGALRPVKEEPKVDWTEEIRSGRAEVVPGAFGALSIIAARSGTGRSSITVAPKVSPPSAAVEGANSEGPVSGDPSPSR